jgi:small redox-active disulfide protein 2
MLEKNVREAIKELSVEANIEHVRDLNKIMEYPILTTPGLVIDEKLVSSGKVPTKAEVTAFITKAMNK